MIDENFGIKITGYSSVRLPESTTYNKGMRGGNSMSKRVLVVDDAAFMG